MPGNQKVAPNQSKRSFLFWRGHVRAASKPKMRRHYTPGKRKITYNMGWMQQKLRLPAHETLKSDTAMKATSQRSANRKSTKKALAIRFLPLIAPFMISTAGSTALSGGAGSGKTTTVPVNIEYSGFQNSMHELFGGMGLENTGLRYEVFEKALTGYLNLKSANQLSEKPLLTIVDLEQSSKKKRLWVIDLEKKDVLFYTYVAHGKGSGDEFARQFSNIENSNMSSPGFYVTQETYTGKHGMSLRLDGMDEGFNSNARQRAIVMHSAEYASEQSIKALGFLGRSQGCPAIPVAQHQAIINALKGKTCLYIHAPVKNYRSQYLNQNVAVQTYLEDNNLTT